MRSYNFSTTATTFASLLSPEVLCNKPYLATISTKYSSQSLLKPNNYFHTLSIWKKNKRKLINTVRALTDVKSSLVIRISLQNTHLSARHGILSYAYLTVTNCKHLSPFSSTPFTEILHLKLVQALSLLERTLTYNLLRASKLNLLTLYVLVKSIRSVFKPDKSFLKVNRVPFFSTKLI